MKKYKNIVTGEVEYIFPWSRKKKQYIENHPAVYQELFEE